MNPANETHLEAGQSTGQGWGTISVNPYSNLKLPVLLFKRHFLKENKSNFKNESSLQTLLFLFVTFDYLLKCFDARSDKIILTKDITH